MTRSSNKHRHLFSKWKISSRPAYEMWTPGQKVAVLSLSTVRYVLGALCYPLQALLYS